MVDVCDLELFVNYGCMTFNQNLFLIYDIFMVINKTNYLLCANNSERKMENCFSCHIPSVLDRWVDEQ